MREHRCSILALASIACIVSILCATSLALGQSALDGEKSAKILSQFAGKWVVSSVAVFIGPGEIPHVIVDDPTLMGRYEDISPTKIKKFDFADNVCNQPYATVKETTGKGLIGEMMSGDDAKRLFDNFSPPIPIDNDQVISEYSFTCAGYDPVTHKTFSYGGDDIVPLPDGRLMDIYGTPNIVVFLNRADPNAKATPSFDCAKAHTSPEVAICKSIELSSYDRAIANTYKETKAGLENTIKSNSVSAGTDKEQLAALRKLQQEEIQKRNKCGDDPQCLLEALRHDAKALVEFVRQSM